MRQRVYPPLLNNNDERDVRTRGQEGANRTPDVREIKTKIHVRFARNLSCFFEAKRVAGNHKVVVCMQRGGKKAGGRGKKVYACV